jgi:RNA polymerase sigma-70 factor (ECF subfamily)
MAMGMLRDADAAAEAVQETGLRFLRQVAGFRGESQIRTWSLGIAINVVREMKRRRARGGAGGGDVDALAETIGDYDAPTAHERSESTERRAALRLVLDDLPDRQREAVVLRFFEDLSVDETARVMGCAAGTVKATVHQALRSLRKRLDAWT